MAGVWKTQRAVVGRAQTLSNTHLNADQYVYSVITDNEITS